MSEMTEVPMSDPMRQAWERYKQTDDYQNTRRWALHEQHVDGSLWAAYCEGYKAAEAKLAKVRECVKGLNPAAIDALRDDNQQQLDADGVMVGVSRQAADETVAMLDELIALMGNAES